MDLDVTKTEHKGDGPEESEHKFCPKIYLLL